MSQTPEDHPFRTSSDCDAALRELHHLLSGELTDQTRSQIEAHLDECEPCARPYGFYGELRRLVQQRCREQVPPGLLERVQAALDDEA